MILWRDLFFDVVKYSIFFAVLDDKNIIVQSLDKIVLTELGVVEVDKVLEMMVKKHGIGHVQYVTDISQPKFIVVLWEFER